MPVLLDSLRVGNSEANNVLAVVLVSNNGSSGVDGLLGMSFLRNFHIKLDNEKRILTLENK